MRNRIPPPIWKVKVRRHRVKPRWIIPPRTETVRAPTGGFARERVVRWAHADAGVPPWRPAVRESLIHTTATSVGEAIAALPNDAHARDGQLSLFDRIAA